MSAPRHPPAGLYGGGIAKVSNEYEDFWNQLQLLDLLPELAEKMLPEPPGTEGFGVEFWMERSDRREWHQVKYQHGTDGRWTLPALKKILAKFQEKLEADQRAMCFFVSAHAPSPLDLLCSRAGQAPTLERFSGHYLDSKAVIEAFKDLVGEDYWNVSAETAWEWLKLRVFFRGHDWVSLEERLSERIRFLVDGSENDAREALRTLLRVQQHNEIDRDLLVEALKNESCVVRDWSALSGGIEARVRDVSEQFVQAVRANLVGEAFLARPETEHLHQLLNRRDPPGTILIAGEEGMGKSSLVADCVEQRQANGQPVLVVDVQGLSQEGTTAAVGQRLGLPDRPAASLAAASGQHRGLLVLDAIDAASTKRGAPIPLFTVVDRLIKEAEAYPNVTVIISCRKEAIPHDPRLRGLVDKLGQTEQVDVGRLSAEQVLEAVASAGGTPDDLSAEQTELLREFNLLRFYIVSREAGPAEFTTAEELTARYFDFVTGTDE